MEVEEVSDIESIDSDKIEMPDDKEEVEELL
jgi:hypothetical protein